MKKAMLVIGVLAIVLICSFTFFACKDKESEPNTDPAKMTKMEFATAVSDLSAGDYCYMSIYYETDYRSQISGKITRDYKLYAFKYIAMPESGIMNWQGIYTQNGSRYTKNYGTNSTNFYLKRLVGMTASRDVTEYVDSEKPTYTYFSDEYTFNADKEKGEYQIVYKINISNTKYSTITRDFDSKGRLTQYYLYDSTSEGTGIYENRKYTIKYYDSQDAFEEWASDKVFSEL